MSQAVRKTNEDVDGKFIREFVVEDFKPHTREEGKDGIGTVHVFRGVISSDADCGDFNRKYGFNQVLSHADGAVNMREVEAGRMNLLDGHYGQPIGQVRKLDLRDGKAHAEIAIVDAGDGRQREVIANWQNGIGVNLSVGYTVEEDCTKEGGTEREYRLATSWTPLEVSLVGIPLDKNAGIGRKGETGKDEPAPEPEKSKESEAQPPEPPTPEDKPEPPAEPTDEPQKGEDDPMADPALKEQDAPKPDTDWKADVRHRLEIIVKDHRENGKNVAPYEQIVERAIATAAKEGRAFGEPESGAAILEVLDEIKARGKEDEFKTQSFDVNDQGAMVRAMLGKGSLMGDVNLADIADQHKAPMPTLRDSMAVFGMMPANDNTSKMRAVLNDYKDAARNAGYPVFDEDSAIPISTQELLRWKIGAMLRDALRGGKSTPRTEAMQTLMRAFTVTGDQSTKGGALIQDEIFIELLQETLYASARFEMLGVTMLHGQRDNVVIPIQSGKNTFAYIGEVAVAALSDFTFGTLKLTPHRLPGGSDYSMQLQDTTKGGFGIASFIFSQMMEALEETRDAMFINGSGTGDNVRGILKTANINTVELGTNGGAITRTLLHRMVTLLQENNIMGDVNALMTPRTVELLKTKVITPGDHAAIWAMGSREPFSNVVVSNSLPSNLVKGTSGATLHAAIAAVWRYVICVQFGMLHITYDDVTQALKGTKRIVLNEYNDIGIMRPGGVVAMKDIVAS